MKPRSVLLLDGPFIGRTMLAIGHGTLVVEGDQVPDGQVARYLPTTDPSRYRFVGLRTVLDDHAPGTWEKVA